MTATILTDSPRAQFMLGKLRACGYGDEREVKCMPVARDDMAAPIVVFCSRIDAETLIVTGIPRQTCIDGSAMRDWRMYAAAKDMGRTHVYGAAVDAIEWAPDQVLLYSGDMTWSGEI